MQTKIKTTKAELLQAIQIVSPVIESNPMIPILANVRFRPIDSGMVDLYGASLHSGVSYQLDAYVLGQDQFSIDAKLFFDTIKAVSADQIEIYYDGKAVTILAGKSKMKLAADDASDFPVTNDDNQVNVTDIECKAFGKALKLASIAASSDDLKPALCGVLFDVSPEVFSLVATDAHKMQMFRFEHLSQVEARYIIPKQCVSTLTAACERFDTVQIVAVEHNLLHFNFDGCSIWCLLVKANYPAYESVVPQSNQIEATVDRSELIDALKRANLYANDTTKLAVFDFQQTELSIKATNLDYHTEATETVDCDLYGGDPIRIGFNAKFLAEMVKSMTGELVKFEMSTPNRAVLMKPNGVESYVQTALIMPVVVTGD